MSVMRKNTIQQRLNIVRGQIEGLGEIIAKKDCEKVISQFKAVSAALKKIMEIYLKENLETCLRSSKKNKTAEFLLQEIIKNR